MLYNNYLALQKEIKELREDFLRALIIGKEALTVDDNAKTKKLFLEICDNEIHTRLLEHVIDGKINRSNPLVQEMLIETLFSLLEKVESGTITRESFASAMKFLREHDVSLGISKDAEWFANQISNLQETKK